MYVVRSIPIKAGQMMKGPPSSHTHTLVERVHKKIETASYIN